MTTFTTQDRQDAQRTPLTDQEIFNIYAYMQDTYTGNNFPVAVGREILKHAQRTPLDMVKILDKAEVLFGVEFLHMDHPTIVAFARAIERAHGIGE